MKLFRQISIAVFLWLIVVSIPSPRGAEDADVAVAARVAAGEEPRSPQPRPWPVDVPVHLSSSFGEFREGHLHAGLDIRSFGREGIPCRALDSGYVARLRASPFGYGKAVYTKLDTGETAVYAHLSEFAPVIDSVVCAAQARNGRYQVDLTLEPGCLPVRRGEVIGYTGRTGTAAPHLHFEIRDSEENPVNPLDIGWVLDDEVPPTIRRVEFLPLTPDSRVNGYCAPLVVGLRAVDARTFAAPETVAVGGRIGIAVQVTDRMSGSSGRLAPFRVELEVDGKRVSSIEMKRFTYDNMQEVELAYDMAKARTRGQHYLFLFRRSGETLWNREFTKDGVIQTEVLAANPGSGDRIHTAVVRATDRAGHVSVASLPLVVSRSPTAGSSGSARDGARARRSEGRGELPGCYFFDDMASVEAFANAAVETTRTGFPGAANRGMPATETGELILSTRAIGESERTLRIRGRGQTNDVHILPIERDASLARDFDDVGFGLTVEKESLYSDAFLYVTRWESDVEAMVPPGSGMRPVTKGVRLGPMSATLRKPIEIRFPAAHPLEGKQAVFHFDQRKGVWSMRTSLARGGTVSALVREPGVYAVLLDSLPPSIGTPQVRTRRSYATGARVREAVLPIADRGSGVDPDRTEVYLDGRKQIARWDGFSEKLFVLLGGPNIIGVHDLSIVAADRLGNTSELVTQLQISPPANKGGSGGTR